MSTGLVPLHESAAHTAIRKLSGVTELQSVLMAFLRCEGKLSLQDSCTLVREPDRLVEESVRGAVLLMVAGLTEVDDRIEARTSKARRMGANQLILFVPCLVRTDQPPSYAVHCDAIYFALPWVGDCGGFTPAHNCHCLRTNPL